LPFEADDGAQEESGGEIQNCLFGGHQQHSSWSRSNADEMEPSQKSAVLSSQTAAGFIPS